VEQWSQKRWMLLGYGSVNVFRGKEHICNNRTTAGSSVFYAAHAEDI
jgi:hypothetical protein